MDALVSSVDSQAVLVIAAVAIVILLGVLLFRILKASLGIILVILAIVLVLQYGFGISANQLWGEITKLPQDAVYWVKSFDLNALASTFSD